MERTEFMRAVEIYRDTVYRVALHHFANPPDAEDAVQEAILSAYTRLDTLRDPEKFKPWLLRILVNQCYTLRRQEKPTVDLTEVADILPAETRDTAESLTLRQAVEQLPQDLQAPITLFYYEDLTIRQIARVLSLSEPAVKTRLSRGRDRLRRLMT